MKRLQTMPIGINAPSAMAMVVSVAPINSRIVTSFI